MGEIFNYIVKLAPARVGYDDDESKKTSTLDSVVGYIKKRRKDLARYGDQFTLVSKVITTAATSLSSFEDLSKEIVMDNLKE